MRVVCHYRNDPERELTDPLPELGGRRFIFRLYSGDWLDPIGIGTNWFEPPFPQHVLHLRVRWPILPFIAWRWPFTKRGGYLGFKLYGVDVPVYGQWLCPPEEVYPGSQAVCLTARPFANLRSLS